MDIDGLGEKQVGVLLERGLVRTAADLYDLREEQLLELDGFAAVSAARLVAAIDASRERPFARVLFAIGIEEVGEVTARNLAAQFGDIDRLLAAEPAEIEATPGVGPKMASHDRRAARPAGDARADRPPARRRRAALRRGRAAAGRGAARRPHVRPDRHAADADAGGRDRADPAPPAGA